MPQSNVMRIDTQKTANISKEDTHRLGWDNDLVRGLFLSCVISTSFSVTPATAGTPGATYSLEALEQKTRLISGSTRVQKQARGSAMPAILDGLQIENAMTGLGDISALAMSEKGELFSADASTGRVWSLTDRGLDGKIDGRTPLCGMFNAPTGLATLGENILFVADRDAIYRCDLETSEKVEHVNLRDSHSDANAPRPLAISPIDGALFLGLNGGSAGRETGAKLIRIDPRTKSARQVGTYAAPIHTIAALKSGSIWMSVGATLMNMDGTIGQTLEGGFDTAVSPHLVLGGLILPGQHTFPARWPDALKDYILVSQSGPYGLPANSSGGFNLAGIPTEFGRPKAELMPIVDGFLNRRGTSAWGRPGAMVIDERGLYLADSWQGTLWRISPTPPIIEAKESLKKTPLRIPQEVTQRPVELTGTQIQGSTIKGSSIVKGSQIEVGSYLVEEFERKAAEEAAKKKAEKEARRKKRSNDED